MRCCQDFQDLLNADLKHPEVVILASPHWKTLQLQTLDINKRLLFHIVPQLYSHLFRKWVKLDSSCIFERIIMNRYKPNKNGLIVNVMEIPSSESENFKHYNISQNSWRIRDQLDVTIY